MALVTDEYELPDLERIVAEILTGIVSEERIGPYLLDTFDSYVDLTELDKEGVKDEDFEFIMIRRRQGYLDDSFTDITGVEVLCFAKTRSRSIQMMDEVTHRILGAEQTTVQGFPIDFCIVLSGPEDDSVFVTDEKITRKSFEMQIRVKWK